MSAKTYAVLARDNFARRQKGGKNQSCFSGKGVRPSKYVQTAAVMGYRQNNKKMDILFQKY